MKTFVTGGELVVRTLVRAGVERLFGLHGAHLDPIFQACLDRRIPIIDVRHEVAAGHAAEGYARAGEMLGVALVTAGGGFTNAITSIANANADRTPVLFIAGSPPLRDAETNTLQGGFDQVAVAAPITKWAFRITAVEHIPRLVAQAIRIATAGPAGPVVLDIPWDVLHATVEEDAVPIPRVVAFDSATAPRAELVSQTLGLLADAKRPVILVGGEARRAGAASELRRFARAHAIPVFSDFDGHGLFPSDDALYGGTLHKLADYRDDTRPDVVLAVGMRFGLFTFGGSDVEIPLAAKVIHVDTSAKEITRLRDADVAIVADARQMFVALNALAPHGSVDRSAWGETVRRTRAERRERLERIPRDGSPIHPYHAIAAVVGALEDDTTIVSDGAETYTWTNEVVHQNRPGSYLTHGYLGSMGIGLGLALGAKAAARERPLLCITGDGAVGFTIAEFDTMVRNDLPIVVAIMNNRSWGACQHFQEMVMGADRVTCTRLENAEYHAVIAGFGCHTALVTELEEIGPAIAAAFRSGKPACVNIIVDVAPASPETLMLMGGDAFPEESREVARSGA